MRTSRGVLWDCEVESEAAAAVDVVGRNRARLIVVGRLLIRRRRIVVGRIVVQYRSRIECDHHCGVGLPSLTSNENVISLGGRQRADLAVRQRSFLTVISAGACRAGGTKH